MDWSTIYGPCTSYCLYQRRTTPGQIWTSNAEKWIGFPLIKRAPKGCTSANVDGWESFLPTSKGIEHFYQVEFKKYMGSCSYLLNPKGIRWPQ